MNTVRFMSL